MIRIKVELDGRFKKDYTLKIKKGTVVHITELKGDKFFASGIAVKVVNIWKSPQWLDAYWFEYITPCPRRWVFNGLEWEPDV